MARITWEIPLPPSVYAESSKDPSPVIRIPNYFASPCPIFENPSEGSEESARPPHFEVNEENAHLLYSELIEGDFESERIDPQFERYCAHCTTDFVRVLYLRKWLKETSGDPLNDNSDISDFLIPVLDDAVMTLDELCIRLDRHLEESRNYLKRFDAFAYDLFTNRFYDEDYINALIARIDDLFHLFEQSANTYFGYHDQFCESLRQTRKLEGKTVEPFNGFPNTSKPHRGLMSVFRAIERNIRNYDFKKAANNFLKIPERIGEHFNFLFSCTLDVDAASGAANSSAHYGTPLQVHDMLVEQYIFIQQLIHCLDMLLDIQRSAESSTINVEALYMLKRSRDVGMNALTSVFGLYTHPLSSNFQSNAFDDQANRHLERLRDSLRNCESFAKIEKQYLGDAEKWPSEIEAISRAERCVGILVPKRGGKDIVAFSGCDDPDESLGEQNASIRVFFRPKDSDIRLIDEIVCETAFVGHFELARISPDVLFAYDNGSSAVSLEEVIDSTNPDNGNASLRRMFSCCEGKLLEYLDASGIDTETDRPTLIIGKKPCALCVDRFAYYESNRHVAVDLFPDSEETGTKPKFTEEYRKHAKAIANRQPNSKKIPLPKMK